MFDAADGVDAARCRSTRTNRTAGLRVDALASARPNLLDQCQRHFAEYPRPAQNSCAFKPLARHSATRFIHSAAFAMSTKMCSPRSARYTGL